MICYRYVLGWVVHVRFMSAKGAELPAHAALIRRLFGSGMPIAQVAPRTER